MTAKTTQENRILNQWIKYLQKGLTKQPWHDKINYWYAPQVLCMITSSQQHYYMRQLVLPFNIL